MLNMRELQHPGRPIEHNPQAVIDAAMLSFWRRGYDGCSLADLLNATGLSKSSLYQSYGNKKQIFLLTLAHYSEHETMAMRQEIKAAKTGYNFFENLIESFAGKTVPHWKSGCLIANTVAEFGQSDPEIGAALKLALNNYVSVFSKAIVKGHEDSSIATDQSAEDLAHYLIISLNGLRTMMKAGMGDAHIRKAGFMILQTLN